MKRIDAQVSFHLVNHRQHEPRVHAQQHDTANKKQHLLVHHVEERIQRQHDEIVQPRKAPVHSSSAQVRHVHARREEGEGEAAEDYIERREQFIQ